jgi:hypothetical protein
LALLTLVVIYIFIASLKVFDPFRATLPPDISGRPPYIISTNPYPTLNVIAGTEASILIASLKQGYASRDPVTGIVKTIPVSLVGNVPTGMQINPLVISVPNGTSSVPVEVYRLAWTPPVDGIGDFPVTLTSSVTMNGVILNADPVPMTFHVLDRQGGQQGEVVDALLARQLLVTNDSAQFISFMPFERVLQAMDQQEFLQFAIQNGLLVQHYQTPQTVHDELYRRGLTGANVDLLRPYGLLQALATASGGSMLVQNSGVQTWNIVFDAYDRLKASYEERPFDALRVFSSLRLLTLLEGRPQTHQEDARRNLFAYTWSASLSGYSNMADMKEVVNLTYNADTLAQQMKNQTDPRKRVLLILGIFIGAQDSSTTSFFHDGTNMAGFFEALPGNLPTPWLDKWSEQVRPRMTAIAQALKDRGAEITAVVTDIEANAMSQFDLKTTWSQSRDAVMSDPRWAEISDRLKARGLTDADVFNLDTWSSGTPANRFKAILWDAVMADWQAEWYDRGLFEPFRDVFPDVRFIEYEHYQRNDLVPTRYRKFPRNTQTVGHIVGTHAGQNLYSATYNAETFDGVVDSPIRPLSAKVASLVANGTTVTLTMTNGIPANVLSAGDTFTFLAKDCPPSGQSASSTMACLLSGERANVSGIIGRTFSIAGRPDDNTVTFASTWTSPPLTFRTNTQGLYLNPSTHDAYDALVADVKLMRQMTSTSTLPVMPWVVHPAQYPLNRSVIDPLYAERIYHLSLLGADDFLPWISVSKTDVNYVPGLQIINNALVAVSSYIGFADRLPVTFENVHYGDGYVMSGMDAGGQFVYRITPDPRAQTTVTQEGTFVVVQVDGAEKLRLPNAIIQSSAVQNPTGYWVLQSSQTSLLLHSSADTWALLQ